MSQWPTHRAKRRGVDRTGGPLGTAESTQPDADAGGSSQRDRVVWDDDPDPAVVPVHGLSAAEAEAQRLERYRLARDKALSLLARREHTRVELKQKLHVRGFEPAIIDATLDALVERGWQSDARFTEQFIEQRARSGVGPRKLRQQLMQRGVGDAPLSDHELGESLDWDDIARQTLAKRFRPGDDYAKMRRFLERRGFTASQARSAIAALQNPDELT